MITLLSYFLFFLNRVRSKKHCFRVAEKENGRNHRIVQKSQETQNQSQRSKEAMLDERLSQRRHFQGKKKEMKIRKAQRADRVATKLSYAATALG